MSAYKKSRKMPIMRKAREIGKITETIVESIDESRDVLCIREMMRSNGYMLGAKIAAAEGGDIYTLRMECAVLVKMAARELQAQTSLLKIEKLCPPEYITLLRDEIEKFKALFIEWVDSFDKYNDIEDEWGPLFK